MIFKPRKTHLIPTCMLFAAAIMPLTPLATNSAYGDSESSVGNTFAAAGDVGARFALELSPFSLLAMPPELEGDVAGTSTEKGESTEPAELEVSDEPLEVTPPATSTEGSEPEPEVVVSDEPLEVVEPKDEPVEQPTPTEPEATEVDEEATPEPEEGVAPEPEQETEPAAEPTPAE